ncbi:MAG: DnaD domain protein [bacterium]|nr:DnaD domain protein [bacterium]
MKWKNKLEPSMTMVPNQFIDNYMIHANGEWVKIYLFLLRYPQMLEDEDIVKKLADAFCNTESDVKRALEYWKKQGVLVCEESPVQSPEAEYVITAEQMSLDDYFPGGMLQQSMPQIEGKARRTLAAEVRPKSRRAAVPAMPEPRRILVSQSTPQRRTMLPAGIASGTAQPKSKRTRQTASVEPSLTAAMSTGLERRDEIETMMPVTRQVGMEERGTLPSLGHRRADVVSKPSRILSEDEISGPILEMPEEEEVAVPEKMSQDISKLEQDEEFVQLVYVVQQYRKKPLTPMECETFAYLYENLQISAELLEYVAEYCVQEGHSSVRYMETVALNWHEKGIKTIQEAKAYSEGFGKNCFAVMKALGQGNRAPATAEKKLIEKWFKDYGFPREIVLEACSRTILTIHSPSFDYVDKILQAWHKGKVHSLKDIEALDKKRKGSRESRETKRAESNPKNRFHNFEQHDYDYDDMMWKMIQNQSGST